MTKRFTHNVSQPFAGKRNNYATCQYVHYRDREPSMCGAPTVGGKSDCPSCAKLRQIGSGSKWKDQIVTASSAKVSA